MGYGIARVTPTVSLDAYATGDVLFEMTEVSLPSRNCIVTGGYLIDYPSHLASDVLDLYFFQKNDTELGSLNGTANITDANFAANQFLGALTKGTTAAANQIDGVSFYHLASFGDTSNPLDDDPGEIMGPVLTSIETGYRVYMSGVLGTVSTAPDFSAQGEFEIILNFKY